MSKGVLFLVSGPSGVGKKTVLANLFKNKNLNLYFSVSMTTRCKRPGEVEGIDYNFVTKEFFKQEIEKNNMLEYAEFFNNYYGTPKSIVQKMLDEGKNVLLEIEVIGAQKVMKEMPNCVSIFLLPPNIATLKQRLIERNTETLEKINSRIEKAREEIKFKDIYQYNVYNYLVSDANKEIQQIIEKEIQLRK